QSGTARFQVPVSRGNDDLAICCGILAGLLLHRLQRGNQSARVIIINRPSTRSDPMFSAGSSTASPWRSIGPGRYTRDWSW
ncbi:MAG TPA: hypothetical protein VGJ84_21865, partial [Polyangiaceae bacterium]